MLPGKSTFSRRQALFSAITVLSVAVLGFRAVAAPLYRPEQVRRTLNTDQFSVSIQKNNTIDVQDLDGRPIADNLFPAITLTGKKTRMLKVDYRQSTRVGINNALGKGNGMHFISPECEWLVATYPGQSFITIDLTYINTSKKAVEVEALSPWTANGESGGSLFVGPAGSDNLALFENGHHPGETSQIVSVSENSPGHLGAVNLVTGDTLIVGYLSQASGTPSIEMSEKEDDGAFHRFGAWTNFDPPVVVEPGGRLQTGTFYFALRESDLAVGLNRFAGASARIAPFPRLPAQFRHGWNAGTQSDLDEAALFAAMDALQALNTPAWAHIHLGTAWQTPGDMLTVDRQRFPRGLEGLSAYAHARNLTLGMTLPTSTADVAALGAFIIACNDWGVDSVELDYGAEGKSAFPPERVFDVLDASDFRGPRPSYVRPAESRPTDLSHWALGGQQFYLANSGNPRLTAPSTVPLQDSSAMTDGQFAAAFSLLALQQIPLRPTIPLWEQSTLRQQILRRLEHDAPNAALPVDLTRAGGPRVWHLPLKSDAGVWTILGLFNWDKNAADTVQMPLTRFGLNAGVRYTVYDFWANTYVGMISNELRVEVPPESVRLLGLRYAEARPMLVASNRYLTQGALDHNTLEWNHEAQQLSGAFLATEGFPYTLTFRFPDPYRLKTMECSESITEQQQTGEIVTISFTPATAGTVTWQAQF